VQAATLHTRHRLRSADRMLDDAEVRVRLLDPATALARGWTITTDESGALVRSIAAVAPGSRLTTRVGDGVILSTVESAIESGSRPGPAAGDTATTEEGHAP
jgi:exodeoxyribonuclease VII large subunit